MKFIYIIFTLAMFVFNCCFVPTFAKEPRREHLQQVLSCRTVSGNQMSLKLLKIKDDKNIFNNGDKAFLEIDGKLRLAFAHTIRNDLIGDLYLAQCVHHTLIFDIGQVSPYLSGIAIRENPVTHQYERLYFAEKALPHWLYFKQDRWGVIIPNAGYETDKKYLVYYYKIGKNQSKLQEHMRPMNNFPVPKRKLIPIAHPNLMQ